MRDGPHDRDAPRQAPKLGVVNDRAAPGDTLADIAFRCALDAAVAAYLKVRRGPNCEIEADVAAGRAAAAHIARVFNDDELVSMLAGVAALHARYQGPGRRLPNPPDDMPF